MNAAQTYWFRRRRQSRPVTQRPTADLEDIASDINTSGKYTHKLVTDLDELTVYEARGPEADAAWRPVGVFDDSQDILPA